MFFQNGVDLYYEVHGQGAPLILIAGLTAHSGNWSAQLPVFAGKHKTILMDHLRIWGQLTLNLNSLKISRFYWSQSRPWLPLTSTLGRMD